MQQNHINTKMLEDGCFGIPEVKRFKLEEGILYKLDAFTEDEQKAYDMYNKVVKLLIKE